MNGRNEKAVLILLLLLAAALRLWRLGEVPPGLCHDEVANWLIARDILAGHHAVYFTAAYGHEPLYHYVQAATVALFGDHWLGLRYPSVAFGLLGLAVTYALTRRLFGVRVALPTAAYLAVGFWPVFYSRVALRAVALPFFAALAAYLAVRMSGWKSLWAALPLGLAFYTYMAARALPLIVAAGLLYLLLVAPRPLLRRWREVGLTLLLAAFVAAPLVVYLVSHPGAESRIAAVREPLDRLLAGDPAPVERNFVANLGLFTVAGDPWPRQNIPGRPVFADPLNAALFYAGVLVAVYRWREPRYGLLLIGLLGSLAPSVATAIAPSSIRDILGLVVVFVFPAVPLAALSRRLSRPWLVLVAPTVCALSTVPYFTTWPQHPVVHFDYQSDLTAVAHRLDELPPTVPVAVGGLSVHTMDGPGLALAARRDTAAVRLCDTRETLVIPGGGATAAYLFIPRVVPLDDDLAALLARLGATAAEETAFTAYRLPAGAAIVPAKRTAALPDGTPIPLPASFSGTLAFLGYDRLPAAEGQLALLSYWRVLAPPMTTLKVFVHLTDADGVIAAQHDGLGSPPRGWSPGDIIVQKHVLARPTGAADGLYTLQIGLYNAPAGPRLTVSGGDRLILPSVP